MSARILVVDDEDGVRLTVAAVLEDAGYTVEPASSLADVRALLAGGALFELAMLDLELDDGLGTDVVEELRAGGVKRIVLVSGRDDAPAMAGIDARVLKGTPVSALLELVERLVGAR